MRWYGGDESSGCGVSSGRYFLGGRPLSYSLVVSRFCGGLDTVGIRLGGTHGRGLVSVDYLGISVVISLLLDGC